MCLRKVIVGFLITNLCSGSLLSQTEQLPVSKKSKMLQNLELSVSLTSSNRKMVSYVKEYELPEYIGYTYYYQLPEKSHFNWSQQVGAVYQSKFLWLTTEIGYERIKYEHGFTLYKTGGDTDWIPGAGGYKQFTTDTISGNDNCLLLAFGVGTPLLHKNKKFNIIPRIKVTAVHSLHNEMKENQLHFKHYYHNYDHPEYMLSYDTISYPSRFVMNKNSFDITAGIQLKAGPFNHWSVGLDIAYALKSSPRLVFQEYKYTEKLFFRNSLTVTYKL